MARPRRKSGWRRTSPDPATIGPLLRQCGFVGCDADPVHVSASFDDQDRPRRVHARYADGWSCTMFLNADRSFSLTQSIRMRVTGKAVPA